MRILTTVRRGDQGIDEGVALLAVTISMFVISLFLLVSLSYGLQNSAAGRKDQDAKTATAAAQAGLEEYLSRLNASPTYYTKGNVDSSNPAFTTGRSIPGASSGAGTFTYKVLTSAADTVQYGIVRIQVTGRSGPDAGRQVARTLTANLRTKGFLNFIYLSDVEVLDPGIAGTNVSTCGAYYYQGRNSSSGCGEIQWTGGDTVNGPLHSNDALQINGAVNYTSRAETGCPETAATAGTGNTYLCTPPKSWWGTQQAGTLAGSVPKYARNIALPDANDSLATYTTPGPDGAQTGPGCYYTGATKITFTGTKMSVLSPGTTSNKTPPRCYDFHTPGTLQSGLAIPPVIYVDETASACAYKNVGYPVTNEAVTVGANDANYWVSSTQSGGTVNKTTNYRCGRGTAYVSGTADAQTTIAAADDILITGNLTTADNLGGTDVIGLIADNNIWVYHPITSSMNELLSSAARVSLIQAAILSVGHSFVVQNWADGSPLGTLNVTGAIAQKYRGPVGTGSGSSISTGYYKNYVYDPRLAFLQPPYFLAPTSSQWLISSITDD